MYRNSSGQLPSIWSDRSWLTQPSWFHFFYFLALNIIFSYFYLPETGTKVLVLLFALLVPVLFLFSTEPALPTSVSSLSELEVPFPSLSSASLIAIIFFAAFIRFYRLTTLESWPTFDETMLGFFGIDIAKGADLQFWYGIG